MTARDYLRVLREGWVVILTCTILATAGATVVTLTKEPIYQATSTLAVSACVAVENSPVCDPVGGMSFAIQRADIYSSTAGSLAVLRRTLELTDAVSVRSTLSEHIEVTQVADSPVIDVTATWHDPAEAAAIANALSEALIEYASDSIDNFESEMTTVNFSIISEAVPPSEPIDHASRTVFLAITLGLLVGVAIAFARHYFNTRLRDRSDVEKCAGITVLADLPLGTAGHKRFSTFSDPVGPPSDSFRRLHAATAVHIADGGIRTLLVASPDNGAASAEVARGLGSAIAETGSRVAVIDLDFRRAEDPSAIRAEAGITDIMEGTASLEAATQRMNHSALLTIPAGLSTSEPATKLASNRLPDVISEIRGSVDVLVLNAAAVMASADALSAARLADGVLLVVELGVTRREDLRESVRSLELAGSKPIGVTTLS